MTYIKLTCNNYSKDNKCYISLRIYENLYYKYKDLFVKGYLNSYCDKNIFNYVIITDISDNPDDIIKGRKAPHIRYDSDGIIDKSIYMKKEKEIMDKLVDINNQISKYSSELKDNKKSLERLNKIEEIVNSSYQLDKFYSESFNSMVDKIVVGTIDENGNKNPNVIKFILKIGKSYDYVLTENKGSM